MEVLMKLLIEQGDYNGAAGYCNDILKVYPDCVDIHFWRIVALYKQGYMPKEKQQYFADIPEYSTKKSWQDL